MGKPGRLWVPRGGVGPGCRAWGTWGEVFSLSTCCVSVAVLGPFQETYPQRSTISITHPMNNRETS